MAFPRFLSLSNCSESGNAASGWIYTRTGAGNFTVNYAGGSDWSLPANTNGSFIFVYAAGIPNSGLDTNNTANDSSNWQIGCYSNGLGSPYLFVVNGVFDLAADTNVNAAVGDWVRFTRAGSTLVVDVSKNSGGSWTTIKTSTGWSTAQVYPKLNFNTDAGASIGPVTATQDVLKVRPRAMDGVSADDSPRSHRTVALAALGEGTTPLGKRARAIAQESLGELVPRRVTPLAALGEGQTPLGRRARTVGQESPVGEALPRRTAVPLAALGEGTSPLARRARMVLDGAAAGELSPRRTQPVAALYGSSTPSPPAHGARRLRDRFRGRERRWRY